jgi:hypothetical protein
LVKTVVNRMNSMKPVKLLNAMKTLLKITGIATWAIGTQLVITGIAFANAELPLNTGASQPISTSSLPFSSVEQRSAVLLAKYTPPNTGGPARTGDSGTR